MSGAQARAAEQERARQAKRKADLKVVEGKGMPRGLRFSPRVQLLGFVGLLGAVLFGVVMFHVVLVQGQYELERMDARADAEQAQYQKMRLQVAELESPSRITEVAEDRLGLVPAEKVTPVTPAAGDLPRTQSGSPSTTSGPTSEDPGAWTSVKPHLSSTSQ
jgi:cell division protein FtsL